MNTKLFNDLYNAYEYFRICSIYEEIQERYQNDKSECRAYYERLKRRKASPVYLNISVGMYLGLMLLILLASNDKVGTLASMSLFLIGAAVVIILNTLICKLITKKFQRDAENFWEKKGQQICEEDRQNWYKARTECFAFKTHNSRFVQFLPQKYRNMTATQWMANAVANRRADTLKEVINLYEEQLHRWEMENIGREMAYQSAQIEKRLNNIYRSLDASYTKLQNLEALEMYRLFNNR